jgi:4-hydroxyphenylacetate 3-monooxygenase
MERTIAQISPQADSSERIGRHRIALRSGTSYLSSIEQERRIFIHGRQVARCSEDGELHKSALMRAEIYDILRSPDVIGKTGVFNARLGCVVSRLHSPPHEKQDWYDKLEILDLLFKRLRYLPCRVGDETVPAVWSMMDGLDFIEKKHPQFAGNIRSHFDAILRDDPYHVSGNADPKSNRAMPITPDRPSVLLHAVKETSAGVVVRGAKYETGAAYANQAFIKPTVGDWSNKALAPYAIGFVFDNFSADNVKIVCRDAYSNVNRSDFPLSGKADEVEAMVVFDDVLIPWENIFFHNDVETASFVRGTLHRYSVFLYTTRLYYFAKLLLGVAYLSTEQCGLNAVPQVREKLAELVAYKEMAHAFLVSAIETGSRSPAGYWMPNQAMMLSGRYLLSSQLAGIMQICRELCGGQSPCTAGAETFFMEEVEDLSRRYYQLDDEWTHERRHRLIAISNDLLNSRYSSSRLNFYMFAHSPPFAQKNAIFTQHSFDDASQLARLFAGM